MGISPNFLLNVDFVPDTKLGAGELSVNKNYNLCPDWAGGPWMSVNLHTRIFGQREQGLQELQHGPQQPWEQGQASLVVALKVSRIHMEFYSKNIHFT